MLSLRLVVDTNIIVSAALKPEGLQRTVFLLAITKPAQFYISPSIVLEYRAVLSRPELRIPKGLRQQYLQLIRNRSRLIKPTRSLQITSDAADNIFLECAEAARADYLITGNTRHFPAFWKNTKIVSSREFITLMAPHLR
jgi:putative PIN family toxin of toxin-antitoxin system